jgi:hypothetical protein
MKWTFHWGSHIPILIKVVQHTKGDVLEVGMGIYSTPLLHWMCTSENRNLVSYETNIKYFNLFQNGLSEFHKTYLIDNLDTVDIIKDWEVVFIDSEPMEQRAVLAKKVAEVAKFIIVHDSEDRENRFYHYKEILNPIFKYRYAYTKFRPNTTVYSNFESLDFLE